jgi:hypothetical protein
MREIIFFIASLAGAAMFTALAVIVAPTSPFWRWVLWSSVGVFVVCAIALLVDIIRHVRTKKNSSVLPSNPQFASAPVAGGAPFRAEPPTMAHYDRDRRRREIDELIASITAGKTLQSLKDAGALAHLLQSAIYTGRSVAEFREELIKVKNSLVDAGNERLQIANRYPEHRDILDLIERRDRIAADADPDPHDLGIWPPVHSYLANPNIPNETLTPPNVATWIFFKDTNVIRELNVRLFGYCDWCEKVKAALVEKRRALDQ